MDAFKKVSGLLHDLLPSLQDAVDRTLAAISPDYWNACVLKNLSFQDRKYWSKRGIDSVADLDWQCVLKIVDSNYEVFRRQCGDGFVARELRAMRDLRNAYAHNSGAVSKETALSQLLVLRRFVKWLKFPNDKLELVNKTRKEIEAVVPRPSITITVSGGRSSSGIIPAAEFAMTQVAFDQLTQIDKNNGLCLGKKVANWISGKENFHLERCIHNMYAAGLDEGYSAVLYHTTNDDYIVIAVMPTPRVTGWTNLHSVFYDAETGHMTIYKIVHAAESSEVVTEWSNDLPEDKQYLGEQNESDGELDLPDHGGGAIAYSPDAVEKIPLSETMRDNPGRASSMLVLDDELCKKLYDGTLENWQVYLHPEQQKAVLMNSDGPMMVKGPAGTGKTVVLVHRAKWLIENVFTGNERILLTTFNKSLEYTIAEMLGKICSPSQRKRIDVVYFDQWLQKAWRKIGGKKILYTEEEIGDIEKNLFRLKLALFRAKGLINIDRTDEFIEREYDSIVQEYKLRTEASYVEAIRPKKFGVLRQDERRKLWQVFQLVNGDPFDPKVNPVGSSTRMRVINHVTKAIESHKFGFVGEYASVLVDESQDMGAAEYRLFGALTGNVAGHENPNSLVFAGDGHQRIYGRMGSLISCGINVRGGRTVSLKKCYRSSNALKKYAERFLNGVWVEDMDGSQDTLEGSEAINEGEGPVEQFAPQNDFERLHDITANCIKQWMATGSKRLSDYAILLREGNFKANKTWRLKMTAKAMLKRGLNAVVVSGRDKYDAGDSIKVMTMHRAKGMQFYGVILNLDGWPHKLDKDVDLAGVRENEEDERRLLYMAITRAVKYVLLTGAKGRPTQLNAKPIPPVKEQSTFDFDAGKREQIVVKPSKRPLPKQLEFPLSKDDKPPKDDPTPEYLDDVDVLTIYDKFVDYLKTSGEGVGHMSKYLNAVKLYVNEGKANKGFFMGLVLKEESPLGESWKAFCGAEGISIPMFEVVEKAVAQKHI